MKRLTMFVSLLILFSPSFAHAILPPDIIFSVGAQMYQVIAILGIIITGGIASVLPLLRGIRERFNNLHKVFVFVGSALLLATFVGFIYIYFQVNAIITNPVPRPVSSGTSTSTENHRYYSDSFTFVVFDNEKKPTLVDLIISRKQNEDGSYIHYYLGNVISNGVGSKVYLTRDAQTSQVLPDLFFSDYKKIEASDHSSREQYHFRFSSSGKDYIVDTGELLSDFIIKNDPEFTSYLSAGSASVSIDGKDFEVSILHQAVYSDDYRPTVFFDEADLIRSKTIQLVLWDSSNNFYLFDQSKVLDYSPAYASHIWGLMKNSEGYTKKIFQGEVSKTVSKSSTVFNVSAPDFKNSIIEASLLERFDPKKDKGFVRGTIIDDSGSRTLYGLGYSHEYGSTSY